MNFEYIFNDEWSEIHWRTLIIQTPHFIEIGLYDVWWYPFEMSEQKKNKQYHEWMNVRKNKWKVFKAHTAFVRPTCQNDLWRTLIVSGNEFNLRSFRNRGYIHIHIYRYVCKYKHNIHSLNDKTKRNKAHSLPLFTLLICLSCHYSPSHTLTDTHKRFPLPILPCVMRSIVKLFVIIFES